LNSNKFRFIYNLKYLVELFEEINSLGKISFTQGNRINNLNEELLTQRKGVKTKNLHCRLTKLGDIAQKQKINKMPFIYVHTYDYLYMYIYI
jgi:hypothetical protein